MKNMILFFTLLAALPAAAQDLQNLSDSATQNNAVQTQVTSQYSSVVAGVKDGQKGKFMYDTSLMRAIKAQNADSVRTLLQARINPNEKNFEGTAPLYKAAELGDPDIVLYLLQAGARVNDAGQYGITPLMAAAAGGHSGAVKHLLEYHADVTARDTLGKTAILHAGSGGDALTFKYLLQADANIEDKDNNGETPLVIALKAKNDDGAADLIKRGANLSAVSKDGMTAQTLAAAYGPKTLTAKALAKRLKQEGKGTFQAVTEQVIIPSGSASSANVTYGTPSAPVSYGRLSGDTRDTPHDAPIPSDGLVIEHVRQK